MKIQNILLPKLGICTEEKMFFRREHDKEREVEVFLDEDIINFKKNGCLSFDTYFNGLSISKWKKYTNIRDVSLHIEIEGEFLVSLINIECVNKKIFKKILNQQKVTSNTKSIQKIKHRTYEPKGMLCFELRALKDNSVFYSGYYDAEVDEKEIHETNIAINICTFKREFFIKRNIDILNKYIINNPTSQLYGHVQVFISDNGNTLSKELLNSETVHMVYNKNVGGAGGFTRGLIEIINHKNIFPATHALMMDDDIIIEPEALFRTFMILKCRKEEYNDLFIGGAMLRLDEQNIQVESGASWNAGELISNKAGFNMNSLVDCLMNEEEEYVEFNAWWYCCTPMSKISLDNLPLPIFIRGDDLEYGLRNMKQIVLLNGIAVWHEAFENKYSSFLQYYILRNLLYDNALHFPQFGKFKLIKRLMKSVARELVYYRYKNIDLIFRGLDDFFAGINFLKKTDGELLHKEIMNSGYKAVPVEQLNNVAMHLERYNYSLTETENRLSKVCRFLSFNGYLLPTKQIEGKNVQVVSMAQCRPINFYRHKKVLNYDITSGKGFVTERSILIAGKYVIKLFAKIIKVMFTYNDKKSEFQKNSSEVVGELFWKRYLNINRRKKQ